MTDAGQARSTHPHIQRLPRARWAGVSLWSFNPLNPDSVGLLGLVPRSPLMDCSPSGLFCPRSSEEVVGEAVTTPPRSRFGYPRDQAHMIGGFGRSHTGPAVEEWV